MRAWKTASVQIPSGNAGTVKTLATMSQLAQAGARDPVVIAAAQNVVRNVPERDDVTTMGAMLTDVRLRMRYTNDPIDVELVKSPRALIDECAEHGGTFVGDCDDASVLLAAMLGAVGIRSRFVVVPAERSRPGEWSHVYVSAMASDGSWHALDPIVRSFGVGQEIPGSALNGPRASFPGTSFGGSPMPRVRFNRIAALGLVPAGGEGLGAAYDPYTDDYSAAGEAQYAAAHPGYVDPVSAGTSSGSGFFDSLFGAAAKVGTAYVQSKAPATPMMFNTARPAMASAPGFFSSVNPVTGQAQTNWAKVAIVGAVAVGAGLVVMKMLKNRR